MQADADTQPQFGAASPDGRRVLPDPDQRVPKSVITPWRTFVKMHGGIMVACDFFCKTFWTLTGKQMAYCLMFVYLDSRKVFVSPSIYHPTGNWMKQQARNVALWREDERLDARFNEA